MLLALLLLLGAVAQDDQPTASKAATTSEGSSRMVFDDRVVRGEAAGGAVAITQRPPRPLPPLVAERVSFLQWTITPVLGPPVEPHEPILITPPPTAPRATAPSPKPTSSPKPTTPPSEGRR